ncbi:sensor histidine kinase [Actinocrispum wychmicini]|uniref:sensor histidine kinase n=1 Tax=Actinocrispum wychmicini TaxID=1213861 RepID=UPI001404C357|nr:nitrate- and nitrite sensing domain-containing protein [Actinocrispum wychmicini]
MSSTARARLFRWRDWRVRTKLAAVTLVPLMFAVAVGVAQIHDQVARAESFDRVDRLVALADQVRRTIGGLQAERAESAHLLTGASGPADIGTELHQEFQATDTAWNAMSKAAGVVSFAMPATATRATEVSALPPQLSRLRGEVTDRELDGRAAQTRYTELVAVLLGFDRALAGEIADPELSAAANALHDVQLAGEEIYLQQALVATGLARGSLSVADLGAVRDSVARLTARMADFRAVAAPDQQALYDRTVGMDATAGRDRLLDQILAQPTTRPAGPVVDPTDWKTGSDLVTGLVATFTQAVGRQLGDQADSLKNAASDTAGVIAVVLFAALLLAAAVMILIGRQLVGSLRVLRRSALEVADHKLPDAVAGLRAGALIPPEVAPVAVTTQDELGQVARAFDAVQDQALRLAAEQAHLRASYGDVFVNLSRRSQGLVQRQLHLLDRLERDEEDPDQLAKLFQLDHLATRMRRNNENLMVLSAGSELAMRAGRPVPLADLLRAAVSEIEQYQRVSVQPPPDLTVLGYAARDLVRLTAELLDNATQFSAPETRVTIASRLADDGTVAVDVLDTGIGMRDEEIAEVNARLADGGHLDASASRRMGLFVVGRLAGRHHVRVELHGGKDIAGIRATVTIPADLLAGQPDEPHVNGHSGTVEDPFGGPRLGQVDLVRRMGDSVPVTRMELSAPQAGVRGDLFANVQADTGWWEPATPPPPAERGIHETTPIFDEMISAWFTADKPEAPTETWEFAADKGFEAAQAVTEVPLGVTAAGLPQRVPKEKLVPGSVSAPPPPPVEPVGQRDAEVTRERLGGLQRGLLRARGPVEDVPATPAEIGFLAAESAAKSPEGVTPAGLPQRVPREKLVPGSITPPPGFGEGLVRGERGAEEVRGRLDELSRGLTNGRRDLGRVSTSPSAIAGPDAVPDAAAGTPKDNQYSRRPGGDARNRTDPDSHRTGTSRHDLAENGQESS